MMIKWLSKATTLQLDFVNPAKTSGISKLASLMAFYATLFAIQVSLWEIPWLGIVLTAKSRLPVLRVDTPAFTIGASIFISFLPFVLVYFLYPQQTIRNIVANYKNAVLTEIQAKIYHVYCNQHMEDGNRALLLEKYLTLYQEISKTEQHSLPLPSVIQFALSFTVSLTLSLVGNLDKLIDLFWKTYNQVGSRP
jgi:hypothetical protein